jgi:chemotaxis protein MotB
MKKLKEKLEQAVKDTGSLEKIRDHIVITVTGEGLRVELIEDEKGVFFESGSPAPSEFGKELLNTLAVELGKLPNKITMEGHTDSKPFSGRDGYSNWELSTDRANNARRWMQAHGMRDDQVTQVRGFADQSLRNPADPEDPSNRRITLIIQYQKATAEDNAKMAADARAAAKEAEKAPAKPAPAPAPAAPPPVAAKPAQK